MHAVSAPNKRSGLACIRYVDDFVILHKDLSIVEQVKIEVQNSLLGVGLKLKKAKTRVVYTDVVKNGQIGFDFLGFNIRRYAVGKYGRNKWGIIEHP